MARELHLIRADQARRLHTMALFLAQRKVKEEMYAKGVKLRYIRQAEITGQAREWIKDHPEIIGEAREWLERSKA